MYQKILSKITTVGKKWFAPLFSAPMGGLYMVLFAISIGVATFIENDFGTSAAQKFIFKTRWFELLLLAFGISILFNVIRFRLVKQKKWTTLAFHLSFLLILLGAAITRYLGSEGTMHIREGEQSNTILSAEPYLLFNVAKNGKQYVIEEPVLFSSLGKNRFNESYSIDNQELKIELVDFVPNPKEELIEDKNGVPVLQVVIGGSNGREEYLLKFGDRTDIYGTMFNFGNAPAQGAFNISYERDSLFFSAPTVYSQMRMATQQSDTLTPGGKHPLFLRSMYASEGRSFVFGKFIPNGSAKLTSTSSKLSSTSSVGLKLKVSMNGTTKDLYITGTQGTEGQPGIASFGNTSIQVAYGSKNVNLPFSIQLRDFILDRYPGTNSASSYASEVKLIDPSKNLKRNQRIYMNHILIYKGYRFFQSSYDPDELGTYLSVNHDAPGTFVTYMGYIILTLGMFLTFFSKKSRFYFLKEQLARASDAGVKTLLIGILFSLGTIGTIQAATPQEISPTLIIDKDHASEFGRLLIQDQQGRIKPMNTYCSEILRKISRNDKLYGLSVEQVVLSMASNPQDWYNLPIIKVGKHPAILSKLGLTGGKAAYRDFFTEDGKYIFAKEMDAAYAVQSRDRGTLEKELLKLDEKVNICNMVFSGAFMNMFPIPKDPENKWIAPIEGHMHNHDAGKQQNVAEKFYPAYISALQAGIKDANWTDANLLIRELGKYQQRSGGKVLPSVSKINAELLLNKLDVFNRLEKWYGLLSLVFLVQLFVKVFKPQTSLKYPFLISLILLVAGFALHTLGLGLRWYVSGRAPWSNGYESMIYIGWTTTLAGLIFTRKSAGGLAATTLLAATILMVAGLSWMDPEITPLVPVLKSYWLTIHVSMEAGSYGFLALGAIIGIINLILISLATEKNQKNTYRVVGELTNISEMTLIGGLFMISIGTYLGGVWANESWGRYWGWDAKETWALVSILVYSFILHMRFIPGFRGIYAFNVATLFGLASVMMTYFGVNYYLSGLHSYAAGDPVPIPTFIYYTVGILLLISLLAFWRHKVHLKRGSVA